MTGPAPGLEVRRAGPGDLAAVDRIERRCFADPWPPDVLGPELASDPLRLALVAELRGEICGYLMAWQVIDQLHVLNLAVDPDERRAGIGTALLRSGAVRAAGRGLTEITLEVRRSNAPARRFYAGHGLREVGLRPRYYRDNGEDAVIMTGPLSPLASTGV